MNREQQRLLNSVCSAGLLAGCFRVSAAVNGGLVFDWHPGYPLPVVFQTQGKRATVAGDCFQVAVPSCPHVPVLVRVPASQEVAA